MLKLIISFTITSAVLYMACKLAVKYAAVKAAEYDAILALVNGL